MDTMVELGIVSAKQQLSIGMIAPEHVPLFWRGIQQLILEHEPYWLSKMSSNELFIRLLNKNMEMWVGMNGSELDGAIFCHWERFDLISTYKVDAVIGKNLRKYLHLGMEKVERYVYECGGSNLDIELEPRMLKMFDRLKFKQVSVTVRKQVMKQRGN